MSANFATCTAAAAAERLRPFVDDIVRSVVIPISTSSDPQHTGGWFAFWRSNAIQPAVSIVGFQIGTVSPDRFRKYKHFANEKARRLGSHLADISSWQSRDVSDPDPMKHQYGGAIRCGFGLIFSFSGFSERCDETVCVIAALRLDLLDDLAVAQIIEASNNQTLADLLASRPDILKR